jgi:hypothetical protein
VNYLPQTYAGNSASGENASMVPAMLGHKLLPDAGWTMENIDRRANHVGPVLEGILREMEEHWRQNQDEEI